MRPRVLIIISVFLVALLAILLLHRTASRDAGTGLHGEVATATNTNVAVPVANGSTVPPLSISNSGATGTLDSNQLALDRQYKIQNIINSKNVAISFFGAVVDQNDQPIAGVRVTLSARHNAYVIPGSAEALAYSAMSPADLDKMLNPKTETTTDAAGRFSWTGETGDAVRIENIYKEGFDAEPGTRNFGAVSGSYGSPVIFKMWSTNVHEQLITGEKRFQIVPDGRAYFISLTDGTIAESGNGDLKVWIKYPEQTVRGQLYDWSCEIDAINGGIQEQSSGTVMYLAPSDGYVPSFQLQQQIKGGQSGETGERQFFLKLNGTEYGQMTIDLYAPYNDQIPGMIRLSYAINPSGSRILR